MHLHFLTKLPATARAQNKCAVSIEGWAMRLNGQTISVSVRVCVHVCGGSECENQPDASFSCFPSPFIHGLKSKVKLIARSYLHNNMASLSSCVLVYLAACLSSTASASWQPFLDLPTESFMDVNKAYAEFTLWPFLFATILYST